MNREEAIRKLQKQKAEYLEEWVDFSGVAEAYDMAIEALRQPEPSIPLSWIEEHIEWLKSLDNEFANLVVGYISVMLKKWGDEQDENN